MNLRETAAPVEVLWTTIGFLAVLVHLRLVHLILTLIKDLKANNQNGALLLTAKTRLVIKLALLLVQVITTLVGIGAMLIPPANPAQPQSAGLVWISSGIIANEIILAALGVWMVVRWSLLDRYLLRAEEETVETIKRIDETGLDSNARIRNLEGRMTGSEQRETDREEREHDRDERETQGQG